MSNKSRQCSDKDQKGPGVGKDIARPVSDASGMGSIGAAGKITSSQSQSRGKQGRG